MVPGDIVMVPEADSVFVMGNVRKPEAVRFVEGMTATRAVALTGGIVKSNELVVIRIYRSSAGAPHPNPSIVNLRAIIEHRTDDPLLEPWDIVEVSDRQGHFQPLNPLGPPTWDPPLPKWSPPLHPRKETSGSTLVTGASRQSTTYSIDSARMLM